MRPSKIFAFAAGLLFLALRVGFAADPPASCPPSAGEPTTAELEQGVRNARDRGFLWKLTKGGRVSYLYGTIHVGKLAWAIPGPKVAAALRDTDSLALEIDVTNPTIAAQLARYSAADPTAPALPPKLAERLERQAAAACIAPSLLAPLHPVMQAITLTTLAGRWDGLDPSYAADLSLAGAAHSLEHKIFSLETVESQVEMLIPDDPDEAIELVDDTLEQLEENAVRPVLQRMAKAWESGNLAELENYEDWCECASSDEEKEFMARMNDARNPHLADGIHALHLSGEKVFAAVGALHMVGPNALPKLMAARGYAVERITFR